MYTYAFGIAHYGYWRAIRSVVLPVPLRDGVAEGFFLIESVVSITGRMMQFQQNNLTCSVCFLINTFNFLYSERGATTYIYNTSLIPKLCLLPREAKKCQILYENVTIQNSLRSNL